MGFTGTKEGCSNGNCGACSLQVDGVLVDSCLVLAAEVDGKSVDHSSKGSPAPPNCIRCSRSSWSTPALQCGICTPGFIMATKALLEKNPKPTEHEVRYWLAGNLCRCTGYDKIVRAVLDAADTMEASA